MYLKKLINLIVTVQEHTFVPNNHLNNMDYWLIVVVNGKEEELLVCCPDREMMDDYERVFRALNVPFRWVVA